MAGNGGRRLGAGRKLGSKNKLLRATAEEILARHNEFKKWDRLLDSKDENVALKALMYVTDRRDGKAQQTVLHGNATEASDRAKHILARAGISPSTETKSIQ